MDLAVYISELLGLQGEVNVPGMGSFTQIRINGYFNEQEKKFYPPAHEIGFQPKSVEGDELAEYIATKKNISLASAKYFIDKYVTGAKSDAATKEVHIDGLGSLYTNGSVLAFKADSKKANDPAFFGLPPINAFQSGERTILIQPPPVKEMETVQPVVEVPAVKEVKEEVINDAPPTVIEQGEEEEYQEEYTDEQPGRRINTGIILLMFIIIVILVLTGLYIYKPSVIERFIDKIHKEEAVKTPVIVPVTKKDTIAKSITAPDTVAKASVTTVTDSKAISTTVDTLAVLHYEILGGAYSSLSKAKPIIDNYARFGLNPRILKRSSHKLFKITLGTYFDRHQAVKVEDSILNIPKINKQEISLETIKPRK